MGDERPDLGGSEEQLESILAMRFREWARTGFADFRAFRQLFEQSRMERLQRELGVARDFASAANEHNVCEGRVRRLHHPTLGEFQLGKALKVSLPRELHGWTVRRVGLDEDL